MKEIHDLLAEHPFFEDMKREHLEHIAGCGSNLHFDAGEFIFREGGEADRFYVIRHGKVALETHVPERGPLVTQTLDEGEVLGWSWVFPPYRWLHDARAAELTRVTVLDGKCLRTKCDEDPVLGYEVVKRFARIAIERLQATRLQLLDIYAAHP